MTNRQEIVAQAVKGHPAAVDFLLALMDMAHVWDDMIDRDVQVSDSSINRAFWNALVVLPGNSFYQQYFTQLHPLVVSAIVNWRAATTMEREGGELDQHIAFTLRSSYTDIIVQCALIIGGPDWAEAVAVMARRFVQSEGYNQYILNLQMEQNVRGSNETAQ